MKRVGIRELKDALSEYVRRAEAGETVLVTDRGRAVAVLAPFAAASQNTAMARHEALVAAGVIRPALEPGPLFRGIRRLRLPKGTAKRLIDADRGER